jgi:DeoR/GlpR family transcriptional regulator of sugar metabolism
MSTHAGFTTPNLMEAETNRALVAAARRLVVVADHTKWELVGISTIAALRDAHVLITDSELTGGARDLLAAEVGELIVAD